jgi:hypothetical protein
VWRRQTEFEWGTDHAAPPPLHRGVRVLSVCVLDCASHRRARSGETGHGGVGGASALTHLFTVDSVRVPVGEV